VTNQIYVTNTASNNVTVIDGATNSTTTVSAGTSPYALAINPVTNKIYVADLEGNINVTVIDGATNTTATVRAGSEPYAVAVNPVTNQIYAANQYSNNVTVITEEDVSAIPLEASIAPLTGNASTLLSPSFDFSASSAFNPIAPPPDGLYFQVDTWQGPWTPATAQGEGTFTGTTAALQPGFHILYAYSTDGQDATSTMGPTASAGSSLLISNITAYGFLVAPPTATLAPSSLDFGSEPDGVTSAPQTLTLSSSGATLAITTITITGTNATDFSETDNCAGSSLGAGGSCTINVKFTPSVASTESGLLTVNDTAGTQTVELAGTGESGAPTFSPSVTTLSFGYQQESLTSPQKSVDVSNNGNIGLTISGVSVSGANAADFAISSDGCLGITLPPVVTTCPVSVTFTPGTTGPETASLVFADDAAGTPQSITITGTGTGFSVGLAPNGTAGVTVSPGNPATYSLQVTAISGFTGTVALSCMGAPPDSTCTPSQASITPNGNTAVPFSVQVTTTEPSVASPGAGRRRRPFDGLRILPVVLMFALAAALLAFASGLRRGAARRSGAYAVAVPLGILLLAIILSNCGGGGTSSTGPPPPSGGTPAGDYTLTITATSNGVSFSQTLTLIVN
jgi:YVTN family beta-propeller protein